MSLENVTILRKFGCSFCGVNFLKTKKEQDRAATVGRNSDIEASWLPEGGISSPEMAFLFINL